MSTSDDSLIGVDPATVDGRTISLVESIAKEGTGGSLVPTLVVQSGPALGNYFAFPSGAGTVIVGRGRDADFRLRHASVSRHHARFCLHEDPSMVVEVEDLGSTNGTRVEGRKVDRPWVLRDGDMVHIGEIAVRFRLMDAADKDFQEAIAKQVESARRDPLTQLLTRRYLDQNLPGLVHAHRRNSRDLSLLMVDIDHFKSINDNYGHLAGDDVLAKVAATITDTVRSADSAIRFGGEEFCVILPGADLGVALRVAERIRSNVENIDLSGVGPDLQVTVSLGAAEIFTWETPEQWMNRADQALYRAKDGGRNQANAAPAPTAAELNAHKLDSQNEVASTRRMKRLAEAIEQDDEGGT